MFKTSQISLLEKPTLNFKVRFAASGSTYAPPQKKWSPKVFLVVFVGFEMSVFVAGF